MLGALTVLFIAFAGVIMPLFIGTQFAPAHDLTVGLSRVLFPVVSLLGLNGLRRRDPQRLRPLHDPGARPLVWNIVIIVCLVVLHQHFHGHNQLYAYAIGVLLGTIVQLAMVLPVLRRIGFRLEMSFELARPAGARSARLMLPVTIGLGRHQLRPADQLDARAR